MACCRNRRLGCLTLVACAHKKTGLVVSSYRARLRCNRACDVFVFNVTLFMFLQTQPWNFETWLRDPSLGKGHHETGWRLVKVFSSTKRRQRKPTTGICPIAHGLNLEKHQADRRIRGLRITSRKSIKCAGRLYREHWLESTKF